jgi:AcrR family transcriptional regulator
VIGERRAHPAADVRRGGRPSRLEAEQIREQILDVATELFLDDGYGITSIEAIARRARISKRTFYHRFKDKADLFGAVVHRVVERLRPERGVAVFEGLEFEETLRRMAALMVRAALSPQALAIQRVIIAEARRFPELAAVLNEQGTRAEAISFITGFLEQEARRGTLALHHPAFAAEQFMQMVVSAPQRRALGLGTPMTEAEKDEWAQNAVDLFLDGCRARKPVPAVSKPVKES